jgi:hypothetical protein
VAAIQGEQYERLVAEAVVPIVAEQRENLILAVGNEMRGRPGVIFDTWEAAVQSMVGAVEPEGLRFLIDALRGKGLLTTEFSSGRCRLALTYDGWEEYGRLRQGQSEGRKAFMAMKFGDPVLERVFAECFVPAIAVTGFTLETVRDHPRAGLIDDAIRVGIRTARFVLADLTHGNRGAYWEAGFGEGLGKPVIYTCEEAALKGSHFDTRNQHTVVWREDDLLGTAERLKASVRATLPADARMTDA